MRQLILFLGFGFVLNLYGTAQQINMKELRKMEPAESYENIHVQKIADDALQSTFVIWIRENVPNHYHAEHTENIYVISGKAIMTMGDTTLTVRKGDYLNIPKGTHHSVVKIPGRKPLKVLSIQSPQFSGADRIPVKD